MIRCQTELRLHILRVLQPRIRLGYQPVGLDSCNVLLLLLLLSTALAFKEFLRSNMMARVISPGWVHLLARGRTRWSHLLLFHLLPPHTIFSAVQLQRTDPSDMFSKDPMDAVQFGVLEVLQLKLVLQFRRVHGVGCSQCDRRAGVHMLMGE